MNNILAQFTNQVSQRKCNFLEAWQTVSLTSYFFFRDRRPEREPDEPGWRFCLR